MYNSKSKNAVEFIDDNEILKTIDYAKHNRNNGVLIEQILTKAANYHGLDYREAAVLLECDTPELIEKIFALATKVKEEIYGRRIVMFAPLYLSNYCVNECRYCPYHYSNCSIPRKKLTRQEIINEVTALQDMGHKRLAIEIGEDPINSPIEYVLDSIKTIYSIKHKNGEIRRVNVNVAATTVENYQKLRDAGIGTYILFQETYHKPTYEYLHPKGPKHNYAYHTEAMDRAMQGGIDDVGIGVLFGLYEYRYDFVGLLLHAKHLEDTFGVGPHTISVPRIRPADDVNLEEFPNAITDPLFKKIVAILRLAVPYTGLIVSTRESEQSREDVLKVGVSQISGASKTSVGGYSDKKEGAKDTEQFDISDNRTLDEIVKWLCKLGYVPSFCTACYREGRTGDRFMRLAKSGQIKNVCQANSLMTFKEYLEDYASEDTRHMGLKTLYNELQLIPNPEVKTKAQEYIDRLDLGERDFRF